MAPEQVMGDDKRLGPPSDVWSVGVILYHFATDQLPFQEESYYDLFEKIVKTDPPRPCSINPHVPRSPEAIITCCLDKNQNRRYSSAQALANELAAFQTSSRVKASSPGLARRVRGIHRRNRLIIPALFLIGIFGTILMTCSYISWHHQQSNWEYAGSWGSQTEHSEFTLWSPRLDTNRRVTNNDSVAVKDQGISLTRGHWSGLEAPGLPMVSLLKLTYPSANLQML